MDEYCGKKGLGTVSESTMGRVIGDLRGQGRLPTRRGLSLNGRTGRLVERPAKLYRLKLRRKRYRPSKPGDLVRFDRLTALSLSKGR